jgi:hypothetical protein
MRSPFSIISTSSGWANWSGAAPYPLCGFGKIFIGEMASFVGIEDSLLIAQATRIIKLITNNRKRIEITFGMLFPHEPFTIFDV